MLRFSLPGRAPATTCSRWLALLATLALVAPAAGQDLDDLMEGHWVVVRGRWLGGEEFEASQVTLSSPEDGNDEVYGVVREVGSDGSWLSVLGQRVHIDEDTRWRGVDAADARGTRVKVSGTYHGPLKFSADSIATRSEGRDRLVGRVDAVRRGPQGVELDVMRWRVSVPADVEYERVGPLEDYPLLEPRGVSRQEASERRSRLRDVRDDDDDIPVTTHLTEDLALGVRLEYERTDEREYDLDASDAEDRVDDEFSVRSELVWTPGENFHARLGLRHGWRWRDDEEDGDLREDRGRVSEMYGKWSDVGDAPFDVQIGRQDFDEPREWLWDQNLDGLRLTWQPNAWQLEVAAARTIRDGSPSAEATDTYLAYLSWERDDRLFGAYVVDRRTDLDEEDYPFFVGVRALGEWLPDHEVWAELATVRGYEGEEELNGWGYDLGTTWSPGSLDPWYFSAGYAFGSGDDDPGDGVDRSFRQTGLQDNNAKLGGVTSFRYYGELLDPELSNLGILTLGVGRRFGQRHSLDLVYHRYTQDVAADRLRDAGIKGRPGGVDRDLGEEIDLVLGSRINEKLHLEVVLGHFTPGAAFAEDAESAFLARVQLRVRL